MFLVRQGQICNVIINVARFRAWNSSGSLCFHMAIFFIYLFFKKTSHNRLTFFTNEPFTAKKKKKNAPNILQPFTWAHSQSSSVPIQDSRFKITLFISGEICLGHRLPQACKKILNTKCIAQKGTHILQSVSHSYIKHNTSKLCQGFRFSV